MNEYLIEVQFQVSPCKILELKLKSGESRQCSALFSNVTLLIPALYVVLHLYQCLPVSSIIVLSQSRGFPKRQVDSCTSDSSLVSYSLYSKVKITLLYLQEKSPLYILS